MVDLIFLTITGKRPFGVSILYMGWDKHYGYQLYQSDPSGNYGGWKATCIGNNSAVSIMICNGKVVVFNITVTNKMHDFCNIIMILFH